MATISGKYFCGRISCNCNIDRKCTREAYEVKWCEKRMKGIEIITKIIRNKI